MKLEKTIERKGFLRKVTYKEVPETNIPGSSKYVIRENIKTKVYDTDDAIADAYKLILGNTSLVFRLLNIIQELAEATDNQDIVNKYIPEEELSQLQQLFEKYRNTKTVFDIKLKEEGMSFFNRIIDRQGKVADIIEKTK